MPALAQKPQSLMKALEARHKVLMKDTETFQTCLTDLRFEGRLHLAENVRTGAAALKTLRGGLGELVKLEEKSLFPYLSARMPEIAALTILFKVEHADMKEKIDELERLFRELVSRHTRNDETTRILTIHSHGTYLVCLLKNHLNNERQALELMMRGRLTPGEHRHALRLFR